LTIIDFPAESTVIGANLLPKRYDVVIYQGDTFILGLTVKDELGAGIALTSSPAWTAKCNFKRASELTPIKTLTSSGGGITLDASSTAGKIVIKTTTDDLTGEYLYDFEMTDPSGNVRTYIGGKVTVTKDVTDLDLTD